MSRRRRPAPRGRRYPDDDYYDDHRPRRRRSGCLAPIRRFFQNVVAALLIAIGTIVFFCLVLLIAFNFTAFVSILIYAFYVGAGLAVLGVLYLVVRIIVAISHQISAASTAKSKARIERERARIEKERVYQARNQVQLQQSKLAREEYTFYEKQEPRYYESPRKTRVIRDDPDPAQINRNMQSPYRTRNLRERGEIQEPLVRVLPEPEVVEESSELEQLGMPKKGQVFLYRNYQHRLKPGQLIAGIRQDGSVSIQPWDNFKILLILGVSSSGKTITIAEKCLCCVKNRGQLVICDPHGLKPDSLINRIAPLQRALMPGTTMAIEHQDIMHNVQAVHDELERRRRGGSMDTPIFLVVEELNRLMRDKEIAKELSLFIQELGQEARGYNIFLILCAQRVTGMADIRNSMIATICHKVSPMESSKMIPARYAKLSGELGVGQTFVIDADGTVEALQQVLITEKDIAASVGGTQHPTATLHSRQTQPIAPRVYGAPARRQAAPSQQNLVLRRTQLVQNQTPATVQPTKIVSQPSPVQPSAGAIWGEETQVNPPDQSSQSPTPKAVPTTEELVPDNRPLPTNPGAQIRQDTFEMLALRRSKKK